MALRSIEQEWERFSEMVFRGHQPSEIQIREMKKAFFAGAFTVICAAQEISSPHVTEEEGVAWFEARLEECEQFRQRLMAEYSEGN